MASAKMRKHRAIKHRKEHPKQVDWLNTIEHDYTSRMYDYHRYYVDEYQRTHTVKKKPQKVPFCINPMWDKCYGR